MGDELSHLIAKRASHTLVNEAERFLARGRFDVIFEGHVKLSLGSATQKLVEGCCPSKSFLELFTELCKHTYLVTLATGTNPACSREIRPRYRAMLVE